MGEGGGNLRVQLLAVRDDDHAGMAVPQLHQDILRQHDHSQALAAALRMPNDAAPAVAVLVAFGDGLHDFPDGEELLNDTVKAVKVEGVEATAENVADGSYKIARPFNIAYKADGQSDLSKDFVAYIMSAEGQAIINEHGYVGSNDAAAYAGNGAEGKLVVGGSSSVSPVMEKLIEAYKAVNANADIELQTTDSTTGMTSAIEGTYDIGMASRELKDDEAAALEHQAIAMDGIAVIVNIANPADDLTVEQVASIFLGDVTKWNEIVK